MNGDSYVNFATYCMSLASRIGIVKEHILTYISEGFDEEEQQYHTKHVERVPYSCTFIHLMKNRLRWCNKKYAKECLNELLKEGLIQELPPTKSFPKTSYTLTNESIELLKKHGVRS